jgi:hypothetical protein
MPTGDQRLTTNDIPQGNDYPAALIINGKRIAVVMPAYNAEKTLEATVGELSDLMDIRVSGPKYHSSLSVLRRFNGDTVLTRPVGRDH